MIFKVSIYTLTDPITKKVKYIGKTSTSLKRRLSGHLSAKDKSKRTSWIKSLKSKGLKPIIELLAEVPEDTWGYWECFYIELLRSWGFVLINGTNGGKGGSTGVPKSEYFKKRISEANKGHTRNRGRKHTDAFKEIKRQQATGRKVSDETRNKNSENMKRIWKERKEYKSDI